MSDDLQAKFEQAAKDVTTLSEAPDNEQLRDVLRELD